MKELCLLCCLFAVVTVSAATTDPELAKLEAALDNACTQMEMNICSGDIAKYLDEKMRKLENQIEAEQDEEGLKLFKASQQAFVLYRRAQAEFMGDLWRGGTLSPLERNVTYAQLTRQRIEVLEFYLQPEG